MNTPTLHHKIFDVLIQLKTSNTYLVGYLILHICKSAHRAT